MPRFMGFVRMEEGVGEPPQSLFDAMDAYIGERAANGTFLDGGGLYGIDDAVNFIVRDGAHAAPGPAGDYGPGARGRVGTVGAWPDALAGRCDGAHAAPGAAGNSGPDALAVSRRALGPLGDAERCLGG